MSRSFKSAFAHDIEKMLEYKEALGFSRNSYDKFLYKFDTFCLEKYPDTDILTFDIVTEWSIMQNTENQNGMKRRMIAVREFGKYLVATGKEAYIIPSKYIGGFKPYEPYIFNDYELKKFFEGADMISSHWQSPNRENIIPVLFRMIYCCGLRPGEVRLLRFSDVDVVSGTIYIADSKTHKDRKIVMSPDLSSLCRQYIKIMKFKSNYDGYFFPNPKGGAYTANWIQRQFYLCFKKSGIHSFQRNSHPRVYDLRHNFATRLMMKWIDEKKNITAMLPYLSAYMGHSEFSDTMYYIHLIPERLISSSEINWTTLSDIIPEVEV